MDEMKNMLKEIDLKVVYRRLEERKKNITNDGKMSRRQLAAAYRGWYGLEAQYHALSQMSDENMIKAKNKNQHLSQKHDQDLKHMLDEEKYVKGESAKAIKALRDDFTSKLAYQYVYKTNSLKNIENAREAARSGTVRRPYSDRYDMYERERQSAVSRGPRPLGSLRQLENYRDELKIKIPVAAPKNDNSENTEHPHVNMLGEKQYDHRSASRNTADSGHAKAFPSIEHAMGVEIKYRFKTSVDNDKDSFYSAPGELTVETNSDIRLDTKTPMTELDMGQNLMLMRKLDQEKFEKRRVLPSIPNVPAKSESETVRETKKRKLPPVPTRCKKIYPPGAKTANDMKKIIQKEASEVLEYWSKDPKNLQSYEKGLEKSNFDIDRPKTTSEMFQQLKKYKKQQKPMTESRENNAPITVRQLTPLPRPLSPVSTRMTEYSSRIASPLPVRERSPSFKQPRMGSEKIPSVSRTSSYKELPDGPVELHENALLTAAERIEKEKLEREKHELDRKLRMAKITVTSIDTDIKNKEKIKRELPSVKTKRSLPQNPASFSPAAFAKSRVLLRSNTDIDHIDTVYKANMVHDDELDSFEKRSVGKKRLDAISTLDNRSDLLKQPFWKVSESFKKENKNLNLERDAYTPLSRKTEPIRRRLTPISDMAVNDQFSSISSFSGKAVLAKLGKKSQFSYDKFSRAPPDVKKRLELRAKNRRKIQLQNAKLDEEREKENDSLANTERPLTRVSFNERVKVFQTI